MASAEEVEMMDFAADPQAGSRLSCQITVSEAAIDTRLNLEQPR